MTHKAIAGMLQRQWLAGDSSVLHNYGDRVCPSMEPTLELCRWHLTLLLTPEPSQCYDHTGACDNKGRTLLCHCQ